MVASYTQIFFHFPFLFSNYFTFISEESVVAIDIINKEIHIEYLDLKTPREVIDQANKGLLVMEEATRFDESYLFLKLTSKNIFKKKNIINATITFSFENQNDALELMSIHRNPSGDLLHPILQNEKVISSNGKSVSQDGMNFILWEKETEFIKLRIKHGKLEENHLLDMVGLEEYWKE